MTSTRGYAARVVDSDHPDLARERLFKIDIFVATDDIELLTQSILDLFTTIGTTDSSFYSMILSHAVRKREYEKALLLLTD